MRAPRSRYPWAACRRSAAPAAPRQAHSGRYGAAHDASVSNGLAASTHCHQRALPRSVLHAVLWRCARRAPAWTSGGRRRRARSSGRRWQRARRWSPASRRTACHQVHRIMQLDKPKPVIINPNPSPIQCTCVRPRHAPSAAQQLKEARRAGSMLANLEPGWTRPADALALPTRGAPPQIASRAWPSSAASGPRWTGASSPTSSRRARPSQHTPQSARGRPRGLHAVRACRPEVGASVRARTHEVPAQALHHRQPHTPALWEPARGRV